VEFMGGKHTKSDLIIKKSLLSGFKTGSELYTTVLNQNHTIIKKKLIKHVKHLFMG